MSNGYRPTLYLKNENPPYMALVIEAIPELGPMGLPAPSVAHYGEQNGDLMRDPEMCFELCLSIGCNARLDPFYWRNDYLGLEQWSRNLIRNHYVCLLELHKQHERFAEIWNNNISLQGFAEAFTDKSILG